MKDGRTRLWYRSEPVVDLESEALLAVEVHPADAAETATVRAALHKAQSNLWEAGGEHSIEHVVADRGYDKGELIRAVEGDFEARTYVAVRMTTRRRCWTGKTQGHRRALERNRRRVRGEHGRNLQRRRRCVVERRFARLCETGELRRMTLRGRA